MIPLNKTTKASISDEVMGQKEACHNCSETVEEKNSVISCSSCQGWFQGKCVGLTATDIKVMGKISNCLWFFDHCLPNAKTTRTLQQETRKPSTLNSNLEIITANVPIPENKN